MFRSTSRPKTAVRVICNVAWASSIGGLALLAEERRRRVALAQKIIENGKRLQAYKAYTGVAALAEFDLGEEWDTRLPNLECEVTSGGHTLTNEEWRCKGRTRRLMPFMSFIQSREEVAALKEESIRIHKPVQRVLQTPHQAQHASWIAPQSIDISAKVDDKNDDTPTAVQLVSQVGSKSAYDIGEIAHADIVQTAMTPADQALPQHPLAHRLQLVVSRYISECLASTESHKREAGFRELVAYLEKSKSPCGPELRKVLRVALAAQDVQDHDSIASQAYAMFRTALEAPAVDAVVSSSSVPCTRSIINKIWEHNHEQVPADEQKYVTAIKSSLMSNQMEAAFLVFLEMSQAIKRPLLSRSTRQVLRELTSAYKRIGLVSVVLEVHNTILRVFKEWRLLYADLMWLMNQRLPQDNLKFTLQLLETLQTFTRLGPDSFAHLAARLVGWFIQHCHVKQGMELLIKIADSGKISLNAEEMQHLYSTLYGQSVEASEFGLASRFLDQLLARDLPLSGVVSQVHQHVEHLIQDDRVVDAATLYLTSMRTGSDRVAILELFTTYTTTSPSFEQTVYDTLDRQIRSLHTDKSYSEIVRRSELVPDTSKLVPDVGFLIYHANALAGPIIEAERAMDNLATSQIPLWADFIHDSHSAYINRCWKQTRNFELTQKLFNKARGLGFQQSASVKTYNVMMRACVEAGHPEEAQHYFDEMSREARFEPNTYTWANIMLAKAAAEDWEAIPKLLEQAQAIGVFPEKGGFDGAFFDKVFAKYCHHHNANEIVKFGLYVMDRDRMSITQFMSNCVVDAAVKAESISLLTRWTEHMHSRGYEMSVGKESVSRILHRIMQSKRLKFQPILREAHELHLTGNDVDIPQLLDRFNAIRAQRSTKAQHLTRPKTPFDTRRSTERAMLQALAVKQPSEALQVYRDSLVNGLPRQQLDLELAIKASLQSTDGNYEEAEKLIENARAAGLSTERANLPIILHDLQHRRLDEQEAHGIVFGYYHSVDEPRIPLHHHLTLAVARNLSNAGNSSGALRILREASDSEWGQRKPFDLALLTMTLRLLLDQRQLDGVEWAVNTVLERNLRIDKTFLLTLKHHGVYARLRSRPGEVGRSQESDDEFRAAIGEFVEICRKRRAQQRGRTLKFAQDTVSLLQRQKQGLLINNTNNTEESSGDTQHGEKEEATKQEAVAAAA